MTRRDTQNQRWGLLAAGFFVSVVLAIWQHAQVTALARSQERLAGDVATLRRTLESKRTRVLESAALTTQKAITAGEIEGFQRPTAEQVAVIDVRTQAAAQADVQLASASLPERVMDAILPSAGARVRSSR